MSYFLMTYHIITIDLSRSAESILFIESLFLLGKLGTNLTDFKASALLQKSRQSAVRLLHIRTNHNL